MKSYIQVYNRSIICFYSYGISRSCRPPATVRKTLVGTLIILKTEKETEDLIEIFDNKSGKLYISSKEKGRGFEVRMIDFKGLEERYNTLLRESLSKSK